MPPRRSAIPHPPVAGLLLLHGRHMRPAELEPFVPALGLPVHCLAPAGPVHHEDGRHSWWPVDMREREAELATGASELSGRYPAGRELARECLGRAVGELHAQLQPGQPLLLAGFSQGGMLALDYLLHTGDPRIGGLAIFSASRLAMDEWRPRLAALAGMPVLLAHGRQDANLSFAAGEALRELLVGAAAQVQWLPFDGGHEVALVVWRALRRFVASRVPA
ncbi:MAG TPA: hypothetical protein VLA16_08550 [Ideonella sp.]|nr:hypothetical protein [Ideonella sp.]